MAAFGFFKSNNNDNQATGRQIMITVRLLKSNAKMPTFVNNVFDNVFDAVYNVVVDKKWVVF